MVNGFKIVGLSVRTTNKDNQAQRDLKCLWEQFFLENLLDKIPTKMSDEIVVVYTDYKSDYKEDYLAIIGARVSTFDGIPSGVFKREFQAENFKKYIARGVLPNAVMETWSSIWENDNKLNRRYSYDFEIYGTKSQNGENSEVEIYIATK